jgi:hypothetical protein
MRKPIIRHPLTRLVRLGSFAFEVDHAARPPTGPHYRPRPLDQPIFPVDNPRTPPHYGEVSTDGRLIAPPRDPTTAREVRLP